MSFRLLLNALIVFWALAVQPAEAHYLWVTVNSTSGGEHAANVIFEESPAARDGKYLDPIVQRGKTWIRTLDSDTSWDLELSDTKRNGKRWLSGPLAEVGSSSVESSVQWGVYRYGKIDALLYYYARYLHVNDHEELHELGPSDRMELDLVPHESGERLEIKVVWREKPVAGASVYIHGPAGFRKTIKTDDKGLLRLETTAKGQYTFRTTVIDTETSGEFEGKQYQQVRHSATLIMQLPLD